MYQFAVTTKIIELYIFEIKKQIAKIGFCFLMKLFLKLL